MAATFVLAVTYEVTRPKIEEQERIEEEAALKAMLPQADSFTKKRSADIEYYEALKDGRLIGYCVKSVANGYGGYIHMIVGTDLAGNIEGLEILQHQETPGLGSKIKEIIPGEKEPWFLKQFKGKAADSVELKKNIDAITGATISSKAVTDSVRSTINKFLAEIKG
jgi:electron transport complex protein RnfG